MRILHTSDWHIGRRFHGNDLGEHHRAYFEHLAGTVRDHDVDVVLCSGDVYDRSLPGVESVALLDAGVDMLLDAGAQVMLTAGNHDSATRLGFGRKRSARSGLHVSSSWQHALEPVELHDVHFYLIPYLEPRIVASELDAEMSHEGVLRAVTDRIALSADGLHAKATVVLAHAFVIADSAADADHDRIVDQVSSDSERDISVGGIQTAPVSLFTPFTYTALGHLHGRSRLAENVRYSGSPLAFSFSERHHTKGSWLLDIDPGQAEPLRDVTFIEAPVPRALAKVRADLSDLLTDAAHEHLVDSWLDVTLTDDERPARAMERVREKFPYAVLLKHEPPHTTETTLHYVDRIKGLGGTELFDAFATHVRGRPLDEAERAIVDRAIDAVRAAEATA